MEFTTVYEEGDLRHLSVNDGDESVPPDFGVLEANPWLSASCTYSPAASEAEAFHDIFGTLSDDQILPKLPVQAMSNALTEREVLDAVDKAETSERKRKADSLFYPESKSEEIGMVSEEMETRQDARPKRTRSAEVHNMSERRRRNRIKGKMRALQELIPNCNKSDTASMLGEAIEYLKALKLQVQMMATSGGAVCQVPYVSIPGIQSIQIPQFSDFMHMQSRPGFGMGMSSTSNSTGLPMIPVPMPFLHPFPSAAVGLYLTSDSRVLPVPQLPVPVMASQTVPTNTATSTVPPQFTRELVSSFKHSNQGESTSQRAPNTAVDSQLSQDALPGSFQPLHMTTTSDVYTKIERKFA